VIFVLSVHCADCVNIVGLLSENCDIQAMQCLPRVSTGRRITIMVNNLCDRFGKFYGHFEVNVLECSRITVTCHFFRHAGFVFEFHPP